MQPFRISIGDDELRDLSSRLARTRWPSPETVPGDAQGVQLNRLQTLVEHWRHQHDWRATQARLNRIPQVLTTIDGTRIHALHVHSRHENATPLLLTHGWPGSFLEFEALLDPLTDPERHGGRAEDAFHVVVPSLPGYGFSPAPSESGWGIHRIARAWAELMTRLGHERFIAGGSDWGTSISTSLAMQQPDRLIGLLLVPPLAGPAEDDVLTPAEQRARADLEARAATGSAYSQVHATRPQTVGYGLTDSPAGLCAWIAEKVWAWAEFEDSVPADRLLDNVSLYWFTRSAASSARLYWESIAEVSSWFTGAADQAGTIDVPVAAAVFPAEVPRPSRRWAERRFTRIVHWDEPPHGGHFAAWEQPGLFLEQVRAARRAILG